MYEKLLRIIDVFFTIMLPIVIIALSMLITVQTILRYVFHKPLLYIEELIVIPSLALYFLGSIWATRNESHMNARILEIFFKNDSSISAIRAISAFVGIFISSWLTYWSYDLLKYSLRVKKVSLVLNYRLSIVECLPLICFSMMTLLMVFECKKYFYIALKKVKNVHKENIE